MTVINVNCPLRPSRTDWFKLGCEIVNPEPAIRCVDPVDRDELKAAGVLCLIAADRPEKAAEIVERVREFLVRYSITSGGQND